MRALILALVSAWSVAAHADWLYWEVEVQNLPYDKLADVAAEVPVYARMVAYLDPSRTSLASYDYDAAPGDPVATPVVWYKDADGDAYWSGVLKAYVDASTGGKGTGWYYGVELYSEALGVLATSDTATYDALYAARSILGEDQTGGMQQWSVTFTSPVPEPTSGVLMLVGMGLLALRRKRA